MDAAKYSKPIPLHNHPVPRKARLPNPPVIVLLNPYGFTTLKPTARTALRTWPPPLHAAAKYLSVSRFIVSALTYRPAHSFTTSSMRSCGAVTSCPQQVQRPLRLVSIEACAQFPIVQTCSAQMNTSTAGLSQWSTRWMVTMKSAGL